jgi:hypothetical protein
MIVYMAAEIFPTYTSAKGVPDANPSQRLL